MYNFRRYNNDIGHWQNMETEIELQTLIILLFIYGVSQSLFNSVFIEHDIIS